MRLISVVECCPVALGCAQSGPCVEPRRRHRRPADCLSVGRARGGHSSVRSLRAPGPHEEVGAGLPSSVRAVTIAAVPAWGITLPYLAKAAVTRGRSAVWLARTRGRPDEAVLRILLYHRVANDDDPLAVPPKRFREQMDHLASEGYSVVGLAEGIALLDSG